MANPESRILTDSCEPEALLERKHSLTNERKAYIIKHTGQSVNIAVERFMEICEIIAKDFPEIKCDMYDCCKDARDASKSIERLCQIATVDDIDYSDLPEALYDQNAIAIASRSLLSSITRILLLVDKVIVKQLITAKRKIVRSLKKLESVMNFTEFVRSFSIFGVEMVELACLTASQRNRLKEERRRAQMYAARQILEKSIMILLTSAKTSLLHFDCTLAKENRDTVFCQIRRAMDLIHFVVKEGILDSSLIAGTEHAYKNIDKSTTVYSTLKLFTYLMETYRLQMKNYEKSLSCNNNESRLINPLSLNINWTNDDSGQRNYLYAKNELDRTKSIWPEPEYSSELMEKLLRTFDNLLEKIQDFTDSAYTSHENRESILRLCNRCKIELRRCFNNIIKNEHFMTAQLIDDEIDVVLSIVKNLSEQLILSVSDQSADLYYSLKMSVELAENFHNLAIKQDVNRLQEQANIFHDYCDHIIEVCKLLRHVSYTETLQIQAKCLTINLRIYGPQILTAAKILLKFPLSKAANENFNAFLEMWKWLSFEITTMAKQILAASNDIQFSKLEQSNILTRNEPTSSQIQARPSVPEEGEKVSFAGIDNKDDASDMNLYNEKWGNDLDENNDILKRAKNMSSMAFSMYQFTKGSGTLRTTQDLFTQAEYFAEEANRLYKVLRQFSYQVPASQHKKDLLNTLEKVPTFVQTLQFTVKDHTVGKAATFVKVDHVIRETKNLMSAINLVVTKCFECANKYKLDFTSLSGGLSSGTPRGDDSNTGGMSDSKSTTSGTEGSI